MADKKVNKYGLSRYIPSPIRREIRQRCGFGCVICGFAIYDYEHIDPPFEDAIEHNPDKMTLLCGNCHNRVTRKRWSKEKVKQACGRPKCFEKGFSRDAFDIGNNSPVVVLGTITWKNTPIILEAFGEPLFRVEPPEVDGGPFRLSGIFYDKSGNKIFRICRNEWQGPIENWDIEMNGSRIIVRQALRDIALQIRTEPPHKLIIERLNMFYKGFQIIGTENKMTRVIDQTGATIYINSPSITRSILESLDNPVIEQARQKVLSRLASEGVTFDGCEAGIILTDDGKIGLGRGCKSIPDMSGGSILMTG